MRTAPEVCEQGEGDRRSKGNWPSTREASSSGGTCSVLRCRPDERKDLNGKLMERGNVDGIDMQQGLYTKEMEPDHAESVNATNKGITIDPGHSNRDKDTAGEEGEGDEELSVQGISGHLRGSPGISGQSDLCGLRGGGVRSGDIPRSSKMRSLYGRLWIASRPECEEAKAMNDDRLVIPVNGQQRLEAAPGDQFQPSTLSATRKIQFWGTSSSSPTTLTTSTTTQPSCFGTSDDTADVKTARPSLARRLATAAAVTASLMPIREICDTSDRCDGSGMLSQLDSDQGL